MGCKVRIISILYHVSQDRPIADLESRSLKFPDPNSIPPSVKCRWVVDETKTQKWLPGRSYLRDRWIKW